MRDPTSLQRWYLSVIDSMADSSNSVEVASIEGLWWAETDTPEDLADVRAHFSRLSASLAALTASLPSVEL